MCTYPNMGNLKLILDLSRPSMNQSVCDLQANKLVSAFASHCSSMGVINDFLADKLDEAGLQIHATVQSSHICFFINPQLATAWNTQLLQQNQIFEDPRLCGNMLAFRAKHIFLPIRRPAGAEKSTAESQVMLLLGRHQQRLNTCTQVMPWNQRPLPGISSTPGIRSLRIHTALRQDWFPKPPKASPVLHLYQD